MVIEEPIDYGAMTFKLTEVAWCLVGAIFVANWRMKYWNLPVFALLVANTFGYTFILIILMSVSLSRKPRYFVGLLFTGLGSVLNFLGVALMVIRILFVSKPEPVDDKSYHFVSEGMLAFCMFLCAITMLVDVLYHSPPQLIETHSSSEDEDEDEEEEDEVVGNFDKTGTQEALYLSRSPRSHTSSVDELMKI